MNRGRASRDEVSGWPDAWVWSECSSLYRLLGGGAGRVGASGWPISDWGRQATRAFAGGLAGTSGCWRVSMYQMGLGP
jgi:hypothetical protein